MMKDKIIQGDCLEELNKLPEKSINMCMTSPPYWALRDYGVEGQLGLEQTFDEYINKLCNIFDEVKRVLRDDGTCWVNLGDTYSGANAGSRWNTCSDTLPLSGGKKKLIALSDGSTPKKFDKSLPTKSLCMIPQRFAIEMVNRGWILRNVIIWHKPNCMPSSVKDRFTVDFEYLFFFSKNKKYYFDIQYEPANYDGRKDTVMKGSPKYDVPTGWDSENKTHNKLKGRYAGNQQNRKHERWKKDSDGKFVRMKRSVWKISSSGFKDAHFAVYPEKFCEIPIKAGCPEGGIVLDPFFGAGTTGLVALKQNKKFIGIELNQEYIEIAKKRLKSHLEQTKLK